LRPSDFFFNIFSDSKKNNFGMTIDNTYTYIYILEDINKNLTIQEINQEYKYKQLNSDKL